MDNCPCDREKCIDPWCAAAGQCVREDEDLCPDCGQPNDTMGHIPRDGDTPCRMEPLFGEA